MFKIYDGREHFYQWDVDRQLIVNDPTITEVHFCNRTGNCSLVCETYVKDGLTLVDVPNILLQTDWKIHVFGVDGNYTKHSDCYEVKSRTKPEDYVYTETEVLNYNTLSNRIAALEAGGGGSGGGGGATCPGSMKIEYQPGAMIDMVALMDAYNKGTYIYLVGEHSFMYDWYSDVMNEYVPTRETGRFAIPLVVIDLDIWTNTVSSLYFGGSDNLGNGVSLYVGGDGMMYDLDINLDCKYLPGGVDGPHDYATMEEVEEAINRALGVIENGTY